MDFSELTSVRIGEYAEQILKSSEHLGNIHCPNKLRGRKQPKIVVKGLHNADAKMLTSVMGLNSL